MPQFVSLKDFWCPEKITQYASTIIRGVDTYFLCRLLSCRTFMPSTQWIQEFVLTPEFKGKFWGPQPLPADFIDESPPVAWNREKFRCSICASEYLPNITKEHSMFANKCVVLSPNGDEELAKVLQMGKNDFEFTFVRWADTPQAQLEARMTEVTLKLVEETKAMNYEELLAHVIQKVNKASDRVFFQKSPLTQKVMNDINTGNSNSWQTRKWRYDHLLKGDISWAQAPVFIKDVTPVMDNDDVILNYVFAKTLAGITGK